MFYNVYGLIFEFGYYFVILLLFKVVRFVKLFFYKNGLIREIIDFMKVIKNKVGIVM